MTRQPQDLASLFKAVVADKPDDGGLSGMVMIMPLLAVLAVVIAKAVFGLSSWALLLIVMVGIFVPLGMLMIVAFRRAKRAQDEYILKKQLREEE